MRYEKGGDGWMSDWSAWVEGDVDWPRKVERVHMKERELGEGKVRERAETRNR